MGSMVTKSVPQNFFMLYSEAVAFPGFGRFATTIRAYKE